MEGYFFVWPMMDATLSLATPIKLPDYTIRYDVQHEARAERSPMIIGLP